MKGGIDMAEFKMRDSWEVWRRKVNIALGGTVESIKSENVTYDNTDSGLTASNVQSAIDEVAGAVDTIEDNLSKRSISFTIGTDIDNYTRTEMTKIGGTVICNIACRLTQARGNGTPVFTISDKNLLPQHDVFGTGVSLGSTFAFKLSAETGIISIVQLPDDNTAIPQGNSIFGNIVWSIK